MTYVLGNLCVYPENMKRNLEKSGGAVFSEKVLLALVDKGVARDAAYRMVQRHALKIGRKAATQRGAARGRGDSPLLSAREVDAVWGVKHHLAKSISSSAGYSVTIAEKIGEGVMRVKIFVSLKQGVLDPQGKAVERRCTAWATTRSGCPSRQVFRVRYTKLASREAAEVRIREMCDKLFANPVIEDYHYENRKNDV